MIHVYTRIRAHKYIQGVGRPVPLFWRRQPRLPAAAHAPCPYARSARKSKEAWPRPAAQEGSGASHAAVGRAHMHTCMHMDACLDVCAWTNTCICMRTSLHMHTLCAHVCVYTHAHACMYTHTQACTQDTNPKLCDSRIEKGETTETMTPWCLLCTHTHTHTCFQDVNPKLSERKT
jgi:hypothetical protein